MSEPYHKTFEELEIKTGPEMIEKFKEKFGHYPSFEVKSPTRLPTRYRSVSGEEKFHMKTVYRPGMVLTFKHAEPGKRKPDAINFVLDCEETDSGNEIVLTPENLSQKMVIKMDDFATVDAPDPIERMPKLPTHSKDVAAILEKRKKEAQVII